MNAKALVMMAALVVAVAVGAASAAKVKNVFVVEAGIDIKGYNCAL